MFCISSLNGLWKAFDITCDQNVGQTVRYYALVVVVVVLIVVFFILLVMKEKSEKRKRSLFEMKSVKCL